MTSLFEIVVHLAACGLFGAALGVWVKQAFFAKPTFFPGVIIRILWVASMSCIISPFPFITAAAIVFSVMAFVVLPLLSEVVFVTHEVLDLRGHMRCRSHEELVFGNFEDMPKMFYAPTGRGHFGMGALDVDTRNTILVLYDPVTGKYDRCMSEEELRQSDRPYSSLRNDQFRLPPMVLTDRECITRFQDGTVLRAQFATPTLKYRTAKSLFHAKPELRNRMNAEQFRQSSGIDGMGGHFR